MYGQQNKAVFQVSAFGGVKKGVMLPGPSPFPTAAPRRCLGPSPAFQLPSVLRAGRAAQGWHQYQASIGTAVASLLPASCNKACLNNTASIKRRNLEFPASARLCAGSCSGAGM